MCGGELWTGARVCLVEELWRRRGGAGAARRPTLANGARVNTRCPQFGWTALTYAAKWGDDALVALLLAQPGVKVDATCEEEGWSALGWAAAGGYVDVAKRLLSAGASPTAGRKNKTPVDVATKSNHAGVLALLETAIHHSNASRDLSESEI